MRMLCPGFEHLKGMEAFLSGISKSCNSVGCLLPPRLRALAGVLAMGIYNDTRRLGQIPDISLKDIFLF